MSQNYFVLLTKVGQAQLSNAIAMGRKLNVSYVQLGDGGEDGGKETNPTENDTQLKRQRGQVPVNAVFQHDSNPHWVVFQVVIPDDVGGFYITELGLFDDDDNLIAIGKYPKTYKATLPDGISTSMDLDVICQIGNVENVELKIDPSKVLATVDYVEVNYMPKLVKTDAVNDDSSEKLATAKAVNDVHAIYQAQMANLPFFPEILTSDNCLKLKKSANKIEILPNQVFRWRGWKDVNTADYTKPQRTFTINDNKTYHLRWSSRTGFRLEDLAALDYNPDQLSESDRKFDTTYDYMLVALVDKGVVTPLKNAIKLDQEKILNRAPSGKYEVPLNWSRTPTPFLQGFYDPDSYVKTDMSVAPGYLGEYEGDVQLGLEPTRYKATIEITSLALSLVDLSTSTPSKINVRVRYEA